MELNSQNVTEKVGAINIRDAAGIGRQDSFEGLLHIQQAILKISCSWCVRQGPVIGILNNSEIQMGIELLEIVLSFKKAFLQNTLKCDPIGIKIIKKANRKLNLSENRLGL